jgi:hypothetical protein
MSIAYWPPLWSSDQSSWLQIQRPGFDSRRYQIFLEVVGLERGPLSLVSTIEELLERKSSGSGLENRGYGCRDPSRWPRGTPYPQNLALTSQTGGGRSVRMVRSRTQTTEFSLVLVMPSTIFSFWPCRPRSIVQKIKKPCTGLFFFVVIFSLKLFACKSCSLLTQEALNLFIWKCATEHSSSCL